MEISYHENVIEINLKCLEIQLPKLCTFIAWQLSRKTVEILWKTHAKNYNTLHLQILLSSDAKTSKSKLSTNKEFKIDTSLVKSEFE